jgi:uncharacterized protein (TIGR02145 family)
MSLLNKKKNEFRHLLPSDGITKTIDSLKGFISETSQKYNVLILIEGSFKDLRRREQQGIISYETVQVEENILRKKLLDFIHDIEEMDFRVKKNNKAPADHFTDPRDGQVYKTLEILGKTWIAENLNFNVGTGCWFYDHDPKHGEEHGRLYTWESAMRACPQGWRLPTREEINELVDYLGDKYVYQMLIQGGKSKFDAKLSGYRNIDGEFVCLGQDGYYWTSTEYGTDYAWYYYFYYDRKELHRWRFKKEHGLPCRCIKSS